VRRSRLLLRVEAELAAAQRAGQQLQAHALRAQHAMLLIRQGDLDEARADLTALHQAAFASPHPELAAWLHLAEGLMAYFTNFGSSCIDRLQRAVALARAARCPSAQAQAQGFLAMRAFTDTDYPTMGQQLREGLAVVNADDGVACARLNLVAGLALHHGGDAEGAATWYAKSRAHGSRVGDDALLSALIHNSAQMRVAAVRRAEIQGQSTVVAGLLPGVDSVHNFDAAMGMSALEVLTPLLRAQVLVVSGDFSTALELFQAHLPEAMSRGLERMGSSLLADTAWCRARLGEHEAALAQARESELELDDSTHADDRGATHGRLAQLYTHLGLNADAERHRALADSAWTEFAAHQVAIREALAGLEPA
jgi:hypothetical protein